MSNKLPQSWVECELKSVFDTSSGGTPKRGNPAYYGGNIPWLKSGELNNGIVTEAEEYITEEGLKNSSAKLFPRGSLLIALYGATVGKLGILDFDSTTNQAICCIYQNKYYDRDFLFYYLLFKKEYLVNQGKGGAQPNISQEIIKALNIPVPPLNEQKRIVEKIEEEFGKIDDGVEKLKLAQEQIKQYRQAVLKSAFEGKLYKTTEWKEKVFSQILEVNPKTDIPQISDEDSVSFLPMTAVQAEINQYAEEFVSYQKVKKGYTKFKNGDVLFAKITPCMENGKACVVDNLKFGIGFGSTEFHILRSLGNITPEFIFYYIVQESFRKKAQNAMTGAVGQRRVPADYLKNTKINIPTIDEQKQIVKGIKKRFEVADEAERVIVENLEKAEQLKQSILKKAFEGRLVSQDPTDEPASELLAKIKAERGT